MYLAIVYTTESGPKSSSVLSDRIISGENLHKTSMSSHVRANISKIEIASSFYPRLKRLQDNYRDKLHLCQDSIPKWAYEALLGPTENPVLFFCSSGNNREYINSLPERILTTDIDRDKLWCVMEEMNHSAVPHMYLVALNLAKREAKIELSTQSLNLLKHLKVSLCTRDISTASIVFIVDYVHDSASVANHGQNDYQATTSLVRNAIGDDDKHLPSRIFFRGEKGIKERCSRLLEKSFCDSFSTMSSSLRQDAQNNLNQITVWDYDSCAQQVMSIIREREDDVNHELHKLVTENEDGKVNTISMKIATTVKAEICSAIEQSVGFEVNDPELPRERCCFFDMIAHKMWFKKSRNESITLSEILDPSSQPLVVGYIQKQLCKTENHYRNLIHELDTLSDVIREQTACLREDIPYELQIYLWRLKHVSSIKKRDNTLVIGISRAEYSLHKSSLKTEIRELLRDWKEFEANEFILEAFAKKITFFVTLESGGTIGHLLNGEYKRGVAGVIGDMAEIVQFAITCAHVAPPGCTIYDDEQNVVGRSVKDLCITTDDECVVGLLDFAAVPINPLLMAKQNLKSPISFTGTPGVTLFDGDFSSLRKESTSLYFHRRGEKDPIFLKYAGETLLDYNKDSDEEYSQESAHRSENRFPFRRIDVVLPTDSNKQIHPGDSGSAVCYFDEERNVISIVFLIVGENDEGFVCCRLQEGIDCLKNRADYHISIVPL